MAAAVAWNPLFLRHNRLHKPSLRSAATTAAFGRRDFDGFARRVRSGEALRDAWRSANDGFEVLLFEARKAAERLDRRYSVSRRFDSATRAAAGQAREIDQELGIGKRWRSFSVDFARNWPRYRKEMQIFLETPVGKSFGVIFLIWFVLSGWWFRFFVTAMWVLPLASPLLIGLTRSFASNFVIEGSCPACKSRFVGYRNQIVRCTRCRNIVWQPRDNGSGASQPDIIDIEIEEK